MSQNLNSDILTLENLQTNYDNTMILYVQAQANYNSALNSITSKKYVTKPGQTYWGTGSIQQKTGSTITACTALCSNDINCKGATFDSKYNTCWTRSGSSGLTPGTSTQTAIIPEITDAALNLKSLNAQLLSLSNQITNFRFSDGTNNSSKQILLTSDAESRNNSLTIQYDILITDRENIQDILDEYSKINQDNNNMQIYNTKNRTYYMMWCYLAFIFAIIMIKITFYPKMIIMWGTFVFYTIIGAILLLLVHFLKLASVFFIFLFIIFSVGIIMTLFS